MNFNKYFNVYDDYSSIQKKVAENLNKYIKDNKIFDDNIKTTYEIGCGTGIFTKEYANQHNLEKIYLNDIFDVKKYIDNFSNVEFIEGDISKIEIPNVDMVLSSSVFQWIEDIDSLLKKIATSTNKLCFSTYIEGNLIEIKEHFGVSLKYLSIDEIENILKKYFSSVKKYKETVKLNFETPIELLKHLKYTGVTGLKKAGVTEIRNFKEKILTYEVAYFICKKNSLLNSINEIKLK